VSRVIPDEWKFVTPVARLYKFVDQDGAVRTPPSVSTPDGNGKLRMAHSYPKGCMVELERERQTNHYQSGKDWTVCRYYDHTEIQEVRGA
jgi:hypothetical protein